MYDLHILCNHKELLPCCFCRWYPWSLLFWLQVPMSTMARRLHNSTQKTLVWSWAWPYSFWEGVGSTVQALTCNKTRSGMIFCCRWPWLIMHGYTSVRHAQLSTFLDGYEICHCDSFCPISKWGACSTLLSRDWILMALEPFHAKLMLWCRLAAGFLLRGLFPESREQHWHPNCDGMG